MSKLTSIDLRRCPKLGSLFPASTAKTLISLEYLIIEDCHGLKHLLTCERAHNSKKQDSVEDDHDLQSVISMFLSLKSVNITKCDLLQHLFCVFFVGGQNDFEDNSCHLQHKNIQIGRQASLVLEKLELYDLPQMTCIWVASKNCFNLQYLKTLIIERCAKLEVIFPVSVVRCLPELERLQIIECKELKQIMEEDVEDKKLSNIVSPQPCFLKLKTVIVRQCHKLKRLFSTSTSNDLPNLEVLIIDEATELEELIGFEQGASKNSFTLQYLKTLEITRCAKLEVIFPVSVVRCLPELEHLKIKECKELKQIMEEDVEDKQGASKNSFNLQYLKTLEITKCAKLKVIFPLSIVRCLPELERLEIEECKELKQIMEEDVEDKKLSNIVSPQLCFPKLKEVHVSECHKLKRLFSTSTSNDLPNLEVLIIDEAAELEELIGFEQGASKNSFNLQYLKILEITKCAKLKVIFPLSIVRCLPELEHLEIEECKELKQIMEEEDENDTIQRELKPCFPKLTIVSVQQCHKLKHLFSMSASNGLPNLEVLIINGADELEELIGCEQRKGEEIGKSKVELPKLKLLIFMHLSNLCQGNELLYVKHRFINKCPKLSLTSTTTLQELRQKFYKLDFTNLGHDLFWNIRRWIYDITKSNEVSKRSGTSEFPSSQINEESEKKFIGEVHGSEIRDTAATSKNSELDERSSPSPLDIHQCETNIEELVNGQSTSGSYLKDQQKSLGETESTIAIPQNIKIGVEAGTALENAMMVSSHLESTSPQSDSSEHKSYARLELDSKPENSSPLQMNKEGPSTSKSESPASKINDNDQSILGSIAEMVREHKQIQNEAPVSKTVEFLELERKKERTSHLQSLEQKLSFVSFPNMTELADEKSSSEACFQDQHALGETVKIEEIGTESPQEATASDRATIKTLLAGAESIDSCGGVATSTGSSGGDILAQDSKVVEKVSTSEIPTVATSLTNSELVESSSPSYLDIPLHKTHSNGLVNRQSMCEPCFMNQKKPLGEIINSPQCLEEEMKDLSMQVGAKSETRNSSPASLHVPLQKNIKSTAEEGTISNNTNVAALSMNFESAISQSSQLVTSQSKSYPHSESESHPKNIEDLRANDIMSLFQPVAVKEHGEDQVTTSSIVAGTAEYQFTKYNRVVEVLAELEKCLKMPLRDIASSETRILHLLTALNFLSGLPFKDTTLSDGLKDIIDSMHKEFPSILCSFKQGFATTDKLTVLEAHQNEVDVTLVSKISEVENLMDEAQHKEAVLKERIIRLKKEINDCEAALSSLQEENKKRGAETIGYKKELENVRKDKSQMVENQRKVEQELFEVAYKWSVLCSKFELNRIVGRNPS